MINSALLLFIEQPDHGSKHNAPGTPRDDEARVRQFQFGCSVNYLPETILFGGNAGAQALEVDMRSGPFAAQVSLLGAGGKGE
jgi:hypothetical protein